MVRHKSPYTKLTVATALFIDRIETLPLAKRIIIFLLLAEQAQKKLVLTFPKTAKGATEYINMCWDWLENPVKPLERINEDYHYWGDRYLLDIGPEVADDKEALEAYGLCSMAIGYVVDKSFDLAGRPGDVCDGISSCSLLDYVLDPIKIEHYLTDEILVFLGLDGQANL